MAVNSEFPRLLQEVREGSESAAQKIVAMYEPQLRRYIRLRLSDPNLRKILDSVDICQSVLANFFVRIAEGAYSFEKPGQLARFLIVMARNKFLDKMKREKKVPMFTQEEFDPADSRQIAPEITAMVRELSKEIQSEMSPPELWLTHQRFCKRKWEEIGGDLGISAEAARKRYLLVTRRVRERFGVDIEN